MVWRYRKSKRSETIKQQISSERTPTPPMVEADGYPAGSELETPIPIRELGGKPLPAEIHGIPVYEMEGELRVL
ncbi:hypothetical protein F4821DRAFT_242113 [Hypoxylon rubiginosum]|uniref:Uncharacterized protein n=1 Tax=Hypoxylon rubiginosum TaxID=110542 RepID=A0ACC0CWR7_9PEZI|nr:hypothetical protein F4821DRAFT_242113 [Hypoxylon rubiginosum]